MRPIMDMVDTIDMIEMESLIIDLIEAEIDSVLLRDIHDRDVIMYLPTPQRSGTEYQKLTYARISAERIVSEFMAFENYQEDEDTPES